MTQLYPATQQERAKALLELRRRRPATDRFLDFQEKYKHDPGGFVRDCIDFPAGGALADYQTEILYEFVKRKRVAIRGPHGLGKTMLASLIVLWAVLTEDDCKVPTTASAWRQLSKFLWPEIRKWAARIKWDAVGRPPFNYAEMLTLTLKRGGTCEAFAVACSNAATIEGAHAKRIVYVYDEAKAIPPTTFDATEGAFSSAGEDTDSEAYAFAISTPGEPAGRFYDIHSRKPGYEDWWVRHVTLEESIAAGRISREWAEQRKRQWGEKSAIYKNRVLGQFSSSDADVLIPLSWVEAANNRWREWDDAGQPELVGERNYGLDVARYGQDKSCLVERIGVCVVSMKKWGKKSTMETVGRVMREMLLATCVDDEDEDDEEKPRINVDVIGVGAGVVDRLRELGESAYGINFGAGTNRTDESGEVQMLNTRAACWWGMRELLQPPSEIMLPPDDDLTGDLTAPHFGYTSSGKLRVENKEAIRARLGRSPDVGDAVILSFWANEVMFDFGWA